MQKRDLHFEIIIILVLIITMIMVRGWGLLDVLVSGYSIYPEIVVTVGEQLMTCTPASSISLDYRPA